MEELEHWSEVAWTEARLSHQAQWADLPELMRNELLTRAKAILAGETPSEGDDNIGRFERAIAAGMASRTAAAAEEVEETPQKATKKVAKKVAKKSVKK